jgi:M6 family metalloprotease-like protein
MTVTQPDGSNLIIKLVGDEFHHFRTTEDGYLLKRNANGYLTYAIVNAKGDFTASKMIARNMNRRTTVERQLLKTLNKQTMMLQASRIPVKAKMFQTAVPNVLQKAYPLNGSPKSLVILVNFSDNAFVTSSPKTAFTNLLDQDGYSTNGGTGSARDYFTSASFGKFAPNFTVVGPFTLPQTLDYYGKNDSTGTDMHPVQMVIDACTAANSTVDFTQYDTDNDGVIDNVFIYYAGYNEAEGAPSNTIWPHRWGVYPKALFTTGSNYTGSVASITFDGKRLMDYACTSELKGNSGSNMCGIGTFCHEFSHVLGLPDYYDTSGKQNHALDSWSIMDVGVYLNSGRTPPTYSAWDRFFLGWLTPEQVSTSANLTLYPIYQAKTQPINTKGQAFLLSASTHNLIGSNPNPKEFFMLEYRKKIGWDSYLPAQGLCIWHIDYDQTAWDNNVPNNYTGTTQTASSHMRVYLQPLSGSSTTPGTAFTSGSFTPLTWTGTNINRPVTDINMTNDSILFKLMGGAPVDPNAPNIFVGRIESLIQFPPTKVNSSRTKIFNIQTTGLSGDLSLTLSGTNAAMFIVSASTISKDSTNLSIGTNLSISYKPTSTASHAASLTISGTGLPNKVVSLQGSGM